MALDDLTLSTLSLVEAVGSRGRHHRTLQGLKHVSERQEVLHFLQESLSMVKIAI